MSISTAARRAAKLLKANGRKVVFAESCTGGLVSGSLTKIAGISEHHCGGMVVYRNNTKADYLGIPRNLLIDPGPVSREVAELMAQCVLQKTPEADIAASVTGHLGPDAPADLDGLVFVAVATRNPRMVAVHELHCRRGDSRVVRQRWVVEKALELVGDVLEK
jgi:nicotinamide-nucleotide amidase